MIRLAVRTLVFFTRDGDYQRRCVRTELEAGSLRVDELERGAGVQRVLSRLGALVLACDFLSLAGIDVCRDYQNKLGRGIV